MRYSVPGQAWYVSAATAQAGMSLKSRSGFPWDLPSPQSQTHHNPSVILQPATVLVSLPPCSSVHFIFFQLQISLFLRSFAPPWDPDE
jgi:hypothetical protein